MMRKALVIAFLAVGIGLSSFFASRELQSQPGSDIRLDYSAMTPFPGTYEGEINGFRVTQSDDWQKENICVRQNLAPDNYTSEQMAQKVQELQGTIWDIQTPYLPAGVPAAGAPALLASCGGHVVGITKEWSSPSVGIISVIQRSFGDVPTIQGVRLEQLESKTIRGKRAVLARTRGLPGINPDTLPLTVYIDEGVGIVTEVHVVGNGLGEAELLKIAEALK